VGCSHLKMGHRPAAFANLNRAHGYASFVAMWDVVDMTAHMHSPIGRRPNIVMLWTLALSTYGTTLGMDMFIV